jgi:hypothetical protein
MNSRSRFVATLTCLILLSGCNLTHATTTSGSSAVSGGATTQPATMRPAASSCADVPDAMTDHTGALVLCFLNLQNGDTVSLSPSAPQFLVEAEASGAAAAEISLQADGAQLGTQINSSGADPFRAEFAWAPTRGSRDYVLTLDSLTGDKSATAQAQITVHVVGAPLAAETPTAQNTVPAVDPAAKSAILQAYQDEFGLASIVPPIARKYRYGVEDPWVSTAFIGNKLYQVYRNPDGSVETYKFSVYPDLTPNPYKGFAGGPVCRPSGGYSMLVVFVDYGNLGMKAADVLADLQAATAAVNAAYAAYPRGPADSTPILQLQTTGAVIPVPSTLDNYMVPMSQVQALTGYDPADFAVVTQVDLDSSNTVRKAWGGLDKISFGYTNMACESTHTMVNIWVAVDDPKEMVPGSDYRLVTTLLSHELFHLFGYPASHLWPCTSGPQIDAADECTVDNIPALMLGWVDVDGDAIPEIVDATPYGITP